MIRVCIKKQRKLLDNRWGYLMKGRDIQEEEFELVLARIKDNEYLLNTYCVYCFKALTCIIPYNPHNYLRKIDTIISSFY